MSRSDAPTANNDRHCGACTACCVYLPLAEGVLGPQPKPAGVPCRHVGPLGCRRHQRRPTWCAKFRCAWLIEPAWPAQWRPDRSGLLCVPEDLEHPAGRIRVYEIRPGAFDEPTGAQLLAALGSWASVELIGFAAGSGGLAQVDPFLTLQPHRLAG